MLRNIARNIVPWNKNILFKRYNAAQVVLHGRRKQNIASQHITSKPDDDLEDSRPIVYSKSKAANMRVDEYRLPYEEEVPTHQILIILSSLAIFLIYFCILREENDIDELMYVDLETSLKRCEKQHIKKATKI